MKNKKGFTLIEMLGAMVILGILGTIVIVAVSKYLNQSKEKAYGMLKDSLYEAVSNCASESNCILYDNVVFGVGKDYTTNNLMTLGYLDSFKNPNNNAEECTGKVTVKIVESTGTGNIKEYNKENNKESCTQEEIEEGICVNGNYKVEVDESYNKYLYKVEVTCPGIKKKDSYYPTGTEKKDFDQAN